MTKFKSIVPAGALIMTLAIGLSGCTIPAKTAARLIDGDFVFVSCEDFEFDTISIGSIDFDHWAEGYTVDWSAAGIGAVEPGDRITYGAPPDGFLTVDGPLPLPLQHHQIEVYLEFEPTDQPSTEVGGVFDSRELSSDYWLRGDGSRSSKPCD